MKRSSYRDRDYAFGQAMLTLRSAIGLTQTGLADYLGVSRRAVGDWEAGSSYPKVDHLKKFIALAVQHRVFPAGREAEEIRSLWQVTRQKVLLDEAWLAALLVPPSKTGDVVTIHSVESRPRTRADRAINLPYQPTPFIGRVAELFEIATIFGDSACRLLTLLGPGGVGKTRLALEAAARQAEGFDNGAAFVALASVGTPNQIVSAIGDALNLSFAGQADPTAYLLSYLRNLHMLIVLDNFEHLLDGAELVHNILQHAPHVTILVTSRVRLNLQTEWLFDVEGLSYPDGDTTQSLTELADYSAAPPDALLTPPAAQTDSTAHSLPSPAVGPRLYWGDALTVPIFYGREWEMSLLTEWLVDERCRVVSLLGLGGIGKSALAVSLMHQVANNFEVVIWRSLRDIPTCEVLLDDLLQVFAPQALAAVPSTLEQRQSLLLEHMRATRVLMILDNMESVLEEGEGTGRLLPGVEGLGRFLRLSAETAHQSCVLLTSREKPGDLVPYEGTHAPVRALRLARLDARACEQLLVERGLVGSVSERARLIEAYAGNPLALKIVSQTVVDLFDGELAPFLEQGEVIFGGIRQLLATQINRLSTIEQSVVSWLAILREPSTLDELMAVLVTPVPRARLLEAVEALHRRSLIERGKKSGSFTLQSVVLEYVTVQFIAQASSEIEQGRLAHLIEYGLELAAAREYVRQNQERLLVAPILAQLRGAYSQQLVIEEQLLALLNHLTTWADDAQGYGPANLVALLRLHRGDLRGLDLSRLLLRNSYLQGVDMQGATLFEATIRDSVFTETFDFITAVAISSTGVYWAASSGGGELRIWDAGGQTLRRTWRAHADMVWALAFSPDGDLLASGGWDGAVKLWDSARGTLLWSGRHTSHANRVAFSPDGRTLASGGNDATVRLWDAATGTPLQTLSHPDAVTAMTWSPDGGLIATGDLKGHIRLWAVTETEPAACILTLTEHTNCVEGLAFSPHGSTLASASWDSTVKLWDVANGSLRDTLAGHADRAFRVAWSPDGRTLATGGRDQTIWLWDAEQSRYRAALRGHVSGMSGLAFTPDSHSLLSGSEDGTLRLWDMATGQCSRVIQGYAASLYDVDWSPDSTQLVSSGTDYLVTVYTVNGESPPHILHGHTGVVYGVGWSSDGQWLASSEWDNAIRLWDPASGACRQVLLHPDDSGNYFYGLAWSPDGQRLAGGTYRRGVQVFEMDANRQRWVGHPFPTWIRHVAWSPDGRLLAGGGDDGIIYIWDAEDGTLFQQLSGHHSMITSIAWCPDGTRLASGSGVELFVWDVQRGELMRSLVGHPGIVHAVAWNPHGDGLATGGSDGTLRWWDVLHGECLSAREGHQGTVQALRRSPDGTKLASCGDDGAIMLWDMDSGEYLQTLRRDRPYERLNITGIRGLTDAQKATLCALGAIENPPV